MSVADTNLVGGKNNQDARNLTRLIGFCVGNETILTKSANTNILQKWLTGKWNVKRNGTKKATRSNPLTRLEVDRLGRLQVAHLIHSGTTLTPPRGRR